MRPVQTKLFDLPPRSVRRTLKLLFVSLMGVFKKFLLASIAMLIAWPVHAAIEVGDAVLPATAAPGAGAPTPFTTIHFQGGFASPPNVFVMTSEDAANPDPCTIRIRNITATSFEAACHEPINEDRASGVMVFQYIAIRDGGLTVPLADGGGSAELVSNCIDTSTQQYGPPCNNCSGPIGYDSVAFPSAFSSTPALLTQIQTSNNLTAGETVFLDVAIESDSLTASGFNVALDQMEAGTGPLGSTEKICYLAVEQNGCQNLDFSGFGGPASMLFQATTGGNTIDGHGNSCSSGEGASFAEGCFSNTPVAIAKQITRNGNNGGFIRRCSVNSSEIVLTFDEDRVSNAERNHIDETASVLAFASTFTNPVTLVRAKISEFGRRVIFDWTTSAETFHLGFDLWGEIDGEWVQLNTRMIPGSGVDTAQSTDYESRVRLNRYQSNKVTRFGISSIDTQGQEEFYGPFESNIEYGKRSLTEPIDWTQTRKEFDQKMAAKGYVRVNNRWRKVKRRVQRRVQNRELGLSGPVANIDIQHTGVQRITGAQLIKAVPRLAGKPLRRVALTLNGAPVPRYIKSDNNRLDANDEVIFVAKKPSGSDAIFLSNYTYQVKLDPSSAVDATTFNAAIEPESQITGSAFTETTLTSANSYSGSIKDDEPWYDRKLIAFSAPAKTSYQFDFSDAIEEQGEGELDFVVHGGIDLTGEDDDHHVQILINNTLVFDGYFDGFSRTTRQTPIPAGLLKQNGNTLEVRLPGDTGYFADMVLIDTLTIRASAPLQGRSKLDFQASKSVDGYEVSLSNARNIDVLAYTSDGAMSVVTPTVVDAKSIQFPNLPMAQKQEVRYAIGRSQDWIDSAEISNANTHTLHKQDADYLIVAHPVFIDDALARFVTLKENQGFKVNVVSWLDVVAGYGYGNPTPEALDRFIAMAAAEFPLQHVLIVGGHSFDYLGITQAEIVNAIPSYYRPVNVLNFSPTDNPYADTDNDGLPDLAIGRWPVRSLSDLEAIVAKTEQWHANRRDTQYQSAVLVSQPKDNRSLDFSKQMRGRVEAPLHTLPEFDEVKHIDIQSLKEAGVGNAVAHAQQQLRESIEAGADLVSFAGHGSPAAWGFQSLVDTDFVRSLNNHDNPLLVMPLACYTTYFESTSVNTLAHQLLFAGTQGAAAVHGPSVLGEYRENAIFAERLLNASKSTNTLGKAILNAKREMVSGNNMLNNWVLLGDPALPLR